MPKAKTSFELSPEGLQLLGALATRAGLSRTAVVETLIRKQAEREGLRGPAIPTPAAAVITDIEELTL